jgi:DNA polymerase-1
MKDPRMSQIIEVNRIYNREIPEAKPLLEKAKALAQARGYVRTVLGRRARFLNGYRIHKALNGIIQGSAADVMKQKLVELHEARKDTGLLLRFTVHDEVDGDIPNRGLAQKVAEVLNRQSFLQFKVPILWETSIGPNWKDCKSL